MKPRLSRLKNSFLEGPFEGGSKGVVPPPYVKIFVSRISTDIKKKLAL